MKKIAIITLTSFLLLGCVKANIQPPVSNKLPSPVLVQVDGIQHHTMYPNDVVLMDIYEEKESKDSGPVGFHRFTIEEKTGDIYLEPNKNYLFLLRSMESHYGGFSNCIAEVHITPKYRSKYKISYKTNKKSCSAYLDRSKNGGRYQNIARVKGVLGKGFDVEVTYRYNGMKVSYSKN